MRKLEIALALALVTGLAFAVDPENNAVNRFASVYANLTGKSIDLGQQADQQKLARVARRFYNHQDWSQDFMAVNGTSYGFATNQQKAAFVLLKLREYGQKVLHSEGEKEGQEEALIEILASATSAEADL